MTLEEADTSVEVVLSKLGGTPIMVMANRAFNFIQFRDHPERVTPSAQSLDGAEAELRLARRMAQSTKLTRGGLFA